MPEKFTNLGVLVFDAIELLNVRRSEIGYWQCFNVGYYNTLLWIRTPILSVGIIPQNLSRTLLVSHWLKFKKIELKCLQRPEEQWAFFSNEEELLLLFAHMEMPLNQ